MESQTTVGIGWNNSPVISSFEGLQGRIGILGGSFDPIHKGHIYIARAAMQQHGLDQVIFIPAGSNPDKGHRPFASRKNRYEMTRAAVAEEKNFSVSDLETSYCGPSYTFKTLQRIRSQVQKEARLFFIVGDDCLQHLHLWDRFDLMVEAAAIITVRRSNSFSNKVNSFSAHSSSPIGARLKDYSVSIPAAPISSSQIRNQLPKESAPLRTLPRAVSKYIGQHDLYNINHAQNRKDTQWQN